MQATGFAFNLWVLGTLVTAMILLALLHQAPSQVKRLITVSATFLAGLFYALEFFIPPDPVSQDAFLFGENLTQMAGLVGQATQVVAGFTFLLGVYNLTYVHGGNIRRRRAGWPNSLAFFIAFLLMAVFAFWRDWYIWADPRPGGGPPSNWGSVFGGSAWEWDEPSGQYFLHTFYPEQPDLNWRNPAVAEAMAGVMRFWFERGVDGFRVDAIFAAIKDALLRDNPPDRRPLVIPGIGAQPGQDPLWSMNRPEVHDVVRHLRRVADAFPGRVLVGEAYVPVEELIGYLGGDRDDEFQLAFNFELLRSPWEHRHLTLAIERSEALHPPSAVPTYAISNHDNPRHALRWGPERARSAAFLLLSLRGVAVLYAGEEIGMVDAPHEILPDPPFDRAGRDGCRTPMQWDATASGGFTTGRPWLPLVDPATRNVADQAGDPRSLLSLYRDLIALRRTSAAMRAGGHRSFFGVAPEVLCWERETDEERVLVLVNTSGEARRCTLPHVEPAGEVLVATSERRGRVLLGELTLDPFEGIALRL